MGPRVLGCHQAGPERGDEFLVSLPRSIAPSQCVWNGTRELRRRERDTDTRIPGLVGRRPQTMGTRRGNSGTNGITAKSETGRSGLAQPQIQVGAERRSRYPKRAKLKEGKEAAVEAGGDRKLHFARATKRGGAKSMDRWLPTGRRGWQAVGRMRRLVW